MKMPKRKSIGISIHWHFYLIDNSLKKVVTHIVDTFFESKAGVSDAIFFPGKEGETKLVK